MASNSTTIVNSTAASLELIQERRQVHELVEVWFFFSACILISGLLFSLHSFLTITKNRVLSLHAHKSTILITAYTFLWYAVSISFTMFNKWFLDEWEGGFRFPICTTSGHMIIKFLLTRFLKISASYLYKPLTEHIPCCTNQALAI